MDRLFMLGFLLEERGILGGPGLSELLDLGMHDVILLASRDDALDRLVEGDRIRPWVRG
jgi:hypothetical protein